MATEMMLATSAPPESETMLAMTVGVSPISVTCTVIAQVIAAAISWAITVHVTEIGLTPTVMASIVSLSGGALVANIISVAMVVTETLMLRR